MSDKPQTPEGFRDHVIANLAELRTGQAQVIRELERMNGTQGVLLTRMSEVELFQNLHPIQCEIVKKMEAFEIVGSTNMRWWRRLSPFLHTLLVVFIVLVLLRAQEILEWFK